MAGGLSHNSVLAMSHILADLGAEVSKVARPF
jgi:crotonobetainyl-CoA:carnitine CoA-transferase CaiB-like acyl-CoA transferase